MINILIPGIPKGCKFFDEIDEKNSYLERGKKNRTFPLFLFLYFMNSSLIIINRLLQYLQKKTRKQERI